MAIYFRSRDVIITDRFVKVRVSGGWRVWVVSELSQLGVVHPEPRRGIAMWPVGTSVLLVILLAHQLQGWAIVGVAVVLTLALGVVTVERRRRCSTVRSQLWARYRGVEVVVFELPGSTFCAACRALVRSMQHQQDENE